MNPLSAVLFWMAEHVTAVRPLAIYFLAFVILGILWYIGLMAEKRPE